MRVVLLHTAFANRRQWAPQAAVLAQAGHEVHLAEMTVSSVDEWADQILEEVSGDFVAMGASMGAYTIGALAGAAPERLLGMLVTSITSFHAFPPAVGSAVFDEDIEFHRSAEPEARWPRVERTLYRDATVDERAARLHRLMMAEVGPDQGATHLAAVRDHGDSWEAVRRLIASGVPLLVVASDLDPLMSVPDYEAFADAIGGRCHLIPDCGHVPPVDQPEAMAQVAVDFVANVEAAAADAATT